MYIFFVTYVKYKRMRGLYRSPVNLSCVLAAAKIKMKKEVRFQRLGYPAGCLLAGDSEDSELKYTRPLASKC